METKEAEMLRRYIGRQVHDSPSPFMNWLQPVILKVEEGSLAFQYTVRPEMTNPFGTLHGGVTAAIIDDAMGATLITYGEDVFHVTVNLSVDYFAAARAGDVIIAETSVQKRGRHIVNIHCDVWNEDKTKLLAKGYSNLIKTPIK